MGEGGETGQLLQHFLDFLRAKIEIMQMICVFENFRTYSKIKLREDIILITPHHNTAHLSLEGEKRRPGFGKEYSIRMQFSI